jgi:hypothetical protein
LQQGGGYADAITVTAGLPTTGYFAPLTIDGDGSDSLAASWDGGYNQTFAISGTELDLPNQAPVYYNNLGGLLVADYAGNSAVNITGTSAPTTFANALQQGGGYADAITITAGLPTTGYFAPLTIDGDGSDSLAASWEGGYNQTFAISGTELDLLNQAPVYYNNLGSLLVADYSGNSVVDITGTAAPTTFAHALQQGSGYADTITLTAGLPTGYLDAPLTIDGDGNDIVTASWEGNFNGSFAISNYALELPNSAPINYNNLGGVLVADYAGNSAVDITGTAAPTTFAHVLQQGSGYADTITLTAGLPTGYLDAPLAIDGDGSDSLTASWEGNFNGSFAISNYALELPNSAPINYNYLGSLLVADYSGNSAVDITGTAAPTTFAHVLQQGSGYADSITLTAGLPTGYLDAPLSIDGDGSDIVTASWEGNFNGSFAISNYALELPNSAPINYNNLGSLLVADYSGNSVVDITGTSAPTTFAHVLPGGGSGDAITVIDPPIQLPLTVQGDGSDALSFAGSTVSLGPLNIYDATADFTIPVSQIGPLSLQSAVADFNTGSASPVILPSLTLTQNSSLGGSDSMIVTGPFDWSDSTLAGSAGSTVTAAGGIAIEGITTVDGPTLINDGTAAWSAGTVNVAGGGTLYNAPTAVFGSVGNTGWLDLESGTLSGFGTINSNVNDSGQVIPAAGGAGLLAINGNYTQTASGVLDIDVGGTTAGGQYGQLAVSGAVSLAGTLDVALIDGFQPVQNNAFQILNFDSATANFGFYNGIVLGNQLSLEPALDSSNLTLTVQPALTTTTLTGPATSPLGQSETFTATVSPALPPTTSDPGPTSTITFYLNGTSIGTGTLSVVGGQQQATLTTSTLPLGTDSLTAAYQGDSNFTGSSSSASTVTVKIATSTSVSSSVKSSVYGQAVTFTATVSPSPGNGTPTGSVAFYDGSTSLGMATLSGKKATVTTTTLPVGSHTITAVYSGDNTNFSSTSAAFTQTVNQAATTTSLSSTINPTVNGQPATFTATVTANSPGSGTPTGTITFSQGPTVLGTANLSGGTATFTTSTALPVGSDTIKATYSGDPNFKTSSGTVAQTVAKASTTTAVISWADPSVFGQSVTYTATVSATAPGSGTPAGSVTFLNGSTTLGTVALSGGSASYSTAKLATGSDTITVTYNGSASFAGSSTSLIQTVDQDATTNGVTSSLDPSTYGQSVTFTATVSASAPGAGTPTGSVAFYDGSTLIGSSTLSGGKATLKTSALPVGPDLITVAYNGDTNFLASTSTTLTQIVNQDATTTKLASSANPAVYGEPVTLTATVGASAPGSGTPTGTVTFLDGTTILGSGTLSGGTTTLSTSSLAVASHTITAVYSGDPNFTTSTSAVLNQKVNQDGSTTALASSVNPSTTGQSVTFTATISASAPGSGTPTGSVTFYVNSKSVGSVGLTAGAATYTTTFIAAGSDTIKAVYSGDANFKTSNASLTQVVDTGGPAAIVINSSEGGGGQVVDAELDTDSHDALIGDLGFEQVSSGINNTGARAGDARLSLWRETKSNSAPEAPADRTRQSTHLAPRHPLGAILAPTDSGSHPVRPQRLSNQPQNLEGSIIRKLLQ